MRKLINFMPLVAIALVAFSAQAYDFAKSYDGVSKIFFRITSEGDPNDPRNYDTKNWRGEDWSDVFPAEFPNATVEITYKSCSVVDGKVVYNADYNEVKRTSGRQPYDYTTVPTSYISADEYIIVKNDGKRYLVTAVGDHAFENVDVECIPLPSTIKRMGVSACKNCKSLFSLLLWPREIADSAFYGCSKMQTIGGGYGFFSTKIGKAAFQGCSPTRVIADSDITLAEVGENAFYDVTNEGVQCTLEIHGRPADYPGILERLEMFPWNKFNIEWVEPMPTGGGYSRVDDVNSGKTVTGVKYFNMMGVESAKPHEGVNIIVATYSDGTTTTTKAMK